MDVRKSAGAADGTSPPRTTQADRRARTRAALLESAARGLSRYGYGNLRLEQVAQDAGYTRGALYHQFTGKQDLALAVTEWVLDTWWQEVGRHVEQERDPLAALLTLARGHAVYCRRDIARVAMALRLEFAGQDDHPVGRAIEEGYRRLVERCTGLVTAARTAGALPDGPPPRTLALAFVGAVEGTSIALSGQAPHDESLVAGAAAGALGLPYAPGDPAGTARTPYSQAT
ncbi:TetR/AcrR family transcriptional regulator [Streptomyces paromomycinus]|uniref:TetR family transcriptional regulator n=1 Tax=Streptomyces paromomycinus TaxID=92743 RepID=A0A401W297_STREY|nr:TetR/AcrR family transcriptional regulator [Streptomyces paromomycinus]GCD43416.1 TetR family transcriptional regulator [Streptomyces paromomycinus]